MFGSRISNSITLENSSGPTAKPSPATSTVWSFSVEPGANTGGNLRSGAVELKLDRKDSESQIYSVNIVQGDKTLPEKKIIVGNNGAVYYRYNNDLSKGSQCMEIGRIPSDLMACNQNGIFAQMPELQESLGRIVLNYARAELGINPGKFAPMNSAVLTRSASTKLTMDSQTSADFTVGGMSHKDHGKVVTADASLYMEAAKQGGITAHVTINKVSYNYLVSMDKYGRVTLSDAKHPGSKSFALIMDPNDLQIDSSGRVHLDRCSQASKDELTDAILKKAMASSGIDTNHSFLKTTEREASSISISREPELAVKKAPQSDLLVHTLRSRNDRLGSLTDFVSTTLRDNVTRLSENTPEDLAYKQEKAAERDRLEKDLKTLINIKNTGKIPTDHDEYSRLLKLAKQAYAGDVLIRGISDED